jgi:hypothetical protein
MLTTLSASFALNPIDTLYLASILGNRPRPIDWFIDYFGSGAGGFEPEARTQGPAAGARCGRASRGGR